MRALLATLLLCLSALPADSRGANLAGIVPALISKVRDITRSCGSVVTSGMRHSYVAGTRRISLHASGRAVDIQGNPGCIYAHLRGWPGGYSVDYARVRHVHLSLGGREDGRRFVHGGKRKHRYAKRHRLRRYARA